MPSVRPVRATDAEAIAAIYRRYVEDTVVSFEETPPGAAEMTGRIAATTAFYPWLVAETDGALLGYAYGRPYHPRAAYRWTCETGIYLATDARRRGIGRLLYAALFSELTARGFVAAVALISVPNAESTRFHEALGFTPVGILHGVGYKFGEWRDVGYWQRDLAGRSAAPEEPRAA